MGYCNRLSSGYSGSETSKTKWQETYILPSALVPHGNGLWRKVEG